MIELLNFSFVNLSRDKKNFTPALAENLAKYKPLHFGNLDLKYV